MVFRCQQCGECCSSMGQIIGIREQTGPFEYRLWFRITGEERQVRVDSDKRDLFLSQDFLKKRPMAEKNRVTALPPLLGSDGWDFWSVCGAVLFGSGAAYWFALYVAKRRRSAA